MELHDATNKAYDDGVWIDHVMTEEMMRRAAAYDARKEGVEQGRAEGREESYSLIQMLLAKMSEAGLTLQQANDEIAQNDFQALCERYGVE